MKDIRKLLKAFTLAEVLITLGIVGVVATLTLPALTHSVMEQQTAAVLSKAINTLETANAKILQERNARTLSSACNGVGGYTRYLAQNLNVTYRSGSITQGQFILRGDDTVTTKDGIVFRFSPLHLSLDLNQPNRPAKYHGSHYEITIDTNGNKGPNRLGKDQFFVWVDYYGQVIPFGGAQYAEYQNTNNILWTNGCPSNRSKKPTNVRACTGSIVDNGYKILYAYNSL